MNGDLRPDLVWLEEGVGSQALFVALNTGQESALFAPAQQLSFSLATVAQGALEMAVGDLDRDGLPELIVADQAAQFVRDTSATARSSPRP